MIEEERLPPLPTRPVSRDWRIVADPDHPLHERLQSAFHRGAPGRGTVVCLSPGPQPSVASLLETAQAELRSRRRARFVLVQQDASASGFARTLFLESGALDVSVVTVSFDDPRAAEWVHAEAGVANGFSEIRYDERGRRLTPIAHVCDLTQVAPQPALRADDTLLVTGGARGIAGECALALAEDSGARLALVGRSPKNDEVVTAHLARLRARGATVGYFQADVTEATAVRRVVAAIRADVGEVTAVLHAAGHNVPALLPALDETQIIAAMRPRSMARSISSLRSTSPA
jgi:enediyne polyketide synthase